jgi:cytochrome bd-type quinol oxidase subunit 2
MTPPLALSETGCLSRLSVIAALVIGPAIPWLLACNNHIVTVHQVCLCTLVLGAWIAAVSGGTLMLRELRIVPSLASTVTVVVSAVWLTWPIWLSPLITSHHRAVGWLCWAHPVLAMNFVVHNLGLWGSPMGGADYTYRYLTVLNQDVAYPRAQSIWPFMIVHGLLALPLLTAGVLLGNLRGRVKQL